MMMIILLKTCGSQRQTDRYTHTHPSLTFSLPQESYLQSRPKAGDSGSEPMLAKLPYLRCSGSYLLPMATHPQSTRELGSALVTLNRRSCCCGHWQLRARSWMGSWPHLCSYDFLPSQQTHSFLLPWPPLV